MINRNDKIGHLRQNYLQYHVNRAVGAGQAGPATAGPILQANENAELNFTVTNLQLHYFEFRQEFN